MRLSLLTYLLLVGCGARTSLVAPFDDDGAGGGGAGAAPSTGGNGGNPSGPGGGGNMPCEGFILTEPIATMAADDDMHQLQPALAYASEALDQITLASEWIAIEGPSPLPSELRHATFSPWGESWSSPIGPSYLADLDAGQSFAAASSTNNRLAFLMSDGGKPQSPEGVLFSLDFGPGSGTVPTKYTVSPSAETALFASLAREPTPRHLVGVGFPATWGTSAASFVVTELDNGVDIQGPTFLGCGDNILSADAVETNDGWVVIASSAQGYEAMPCGDPGPVGPTDFMYVGHADTQGNVSPCAIMGGVKHGVVNGVAAAPHPSGAWAVWSSSFGAINALRVDPTGCAIGEPFSVTRPRDTALGYTVAAGSIGTAVVVAFLEETSAGYALTIRVFDESGAMLFDTSHEGRVAFDRLDVLGSPQGDAFVVAFRTTTDAGISRVSVARFGCP